MVDDAELERELEAARLLPLELERKLAQSQARERGLCELIGEGPTRRRGTRPVAAC